ncbi:hypothetical protein J1605_019546 [Eschrichtius robustus]|uniref:Uncharacterized protein n=1 Tax=Eschrichtius robustus TaxID=9764 RepID=A0AB34HNY5_ESCRO|nr:hypothetical protein J1605_019546 [Eschrichtius robustus]
MGSYGAPSPAQSLSWMLPGALHPWSGSAHFPAELRWQCSPPWLCPEERLVTSPCRGSSAASCPFPSSLVVVPPSFGVLPVYLLGSVVAPLRHPSRGPSCTLRAQLSQALEELGGQKQRADMEGHGCGEGRGICTRRRVGGTRDAAVGTGTGGWRRAPVSVSAPPSPASPGRAQPIKLELVGGARAGVLLHVFLGESDVSQGGEPLAGLVPPNSAQGPSPGHWGTLGTVLHGELWRPCALSQGY